MCVAAWLCSPRALASYTTGLGIGFDVTTTLSPDAYLPRPSRIQTSGAQGNFDSGVYGYDGAGNIRAVGGDTFGYDSRSRLLSASYPQSGSQQFSYDRFGNMTSRTGVNPGSFPIDTSTNHLAGYDYLRGNLTGPSGSPSYAWDGLDRMTSQALGSWTYLYNAGNERIGKKPQGLDWTFTLRDPGERVSTEFAGSTPSRDNVFLGNLLVASYANTAVGGNSSPWSFYSSDHLGTPRLVTHIDVADSESHKYWPYGDEVTAQTAPQRLRFAAMEGDPESTRFYDHARHHDFGLARFIGPDKLSGKLNDAQSWNRYAYAKNNPLKYVDPNGREAYLFIVAPSSGSSTWGHAAIYVTSPRGNAGVSYGGDFGFERGVRGFLSGYANERNRQVKMFTLETTAAQDVKMVEFLKANPQYGGADPNVSMIFQNCTTAACNALKAGGVIPGDSNPARMLGLSDQPEKLGAALENGSMSNLVRATNTILPGYAPSLDLAVQATQAAPQQNPACAIDDASCKAREEYLRRTR